MMRYSSCPPALAATIREAIQRAIDRGARTRDLDRAGGITAAEMGNRIETCLEDGLERSSNNATPSP